MDAPSCIAEAEKLRQDGNAAFKRGNLEKACEIYLNALSQFAIVARFVAPTTYSLTETDLDLKAAVCLNVALCYIRLGKPELAVEHCDEVLEVRPSSVKALYRRGTAYIALGKYGAAGVDLAYARHLEPRNDEVAQRFQESVTKYDEAFPLHAATRSSKELERLITIEGRDVNSVDDFGMSALHCATGSGQAAAVATLLAHGADVHMKNLGGDTAMGAAILNGHAEIVEMLKGSGAESPNPCAYCLGEFAKGDLVNICPHCKARAHHECYKKDMAVRGAAMSCATCRRRLA